MLTKTSQIEAYLIREILNGKFREGEKLPSRNQLCRRFHCSRSIVEHAVERLRCNGYAAARQGSGTFVSNQYLSRKTIRSLKIIADYPVVTDHPPLLAAPDLEDLNISVEWIPIEKAVSELANLYGSENAVITIRPPVQQIPLLESLKRRNVPVLLLNRDYEGFDHIITDPRSSIREGISWLLIEAGREIAFVARRPTVSYPYLAERILSFYESAIEFGAKLPPEWSLCKRFTSFTEDIAEIGHALFGSPKRPKGIFILCSDLVLPVVTCGQGYGVFPGKDYKLLTFDTVPLLTKQSGIAMMEQPDLLFEQEIRRWLQSVKNDQPFRSALKTNLNIY